jgi:iron complex transport system substrate-binding protein
MLQRSAENRHLRPIAGPFEDNSRPSHAHVLSRRRFTSGLVCLLSTLSLAAQQRPRSIVSTAPSITEALFALGLGDQVVGVSQYCDFPPAVAKLPRVGSYIKPNLEAIARLAPDLVVLQAASSELTDRLIALHIAFVEVPHGTLADVFTGIQIIAKSAGVPERSAPLVNRIQSALQGIRAKAHAMPSPHVVAILSRRQGTLTDITAIGPDNYLNELLEVAGGTNVLAKPGLPRYPHISMETIIRENPDVILDLSSMEDPVAARRAERPAWLALWQQGQLLKAARSGHIYFGDSNALLVPGPRAPEAAEILFQYMHGNGEEKQG